MFPFKKVREVWVANVTDWQRQMMEVYGYMPTFDYELCLECGHTVISPKPSRRKQCKKCGGIKGDYMSIRSVIDLLTHIDLNQAIPEMKLLINERYWRLSEVDLVKVLNPRFRPVFKNGIIVGFDVEEFST